MALKWLFVVPIIIPILGVSSQTPCRDNGDYSREGLTKFPRFDPECDLFHLRLTENELTNITADDLEGHFNLRSLNVAQNQITNIVEGAFSPAIHLERVTLSGNRIQDLNQCFRDSESITDVDIDHNMIEHLDSNSFKGAPHLGNIDLSHNRISSINDTTFSLLHKLQTLKLAYNRIRSLEESVFASNGNLRTLDLSYNRLRNLSPQLFAGLTALRHLKLSGNHFALMYFQVTSPYIFLQADNCGQTKIPNIQCNATNDCVIEMEFSDNNLECNCYVLEVTLSSNRTVRCIDEDTGAYSPLQCVDPHSTTAELPPRTTASKATHPGENKLGVPTMSELEGHRRPWLLPVVILPAILVIVIAFFVIRRLRKSSNVSGDVV